MAFYDDLATTARLLLARYGGPVYLKRIATDTFSPVTGQSSATTTTLTTTGFVRNFDTRAIDGIRVQHGDRLLVLDDSVSPRMGDTVLAGGDYWSILGIETKQPTTIPLVYFVHIRK